MSTGNFRINLVMIGVVVFFIISSPVLSQTRSLTPKPGVSFPPMGNGYYESLPASYNSSSEKYPVIIFFHGLSERGDGSLAQLPWILNNGIMRLLNNKTFPETFTVNNKTSSFIVIAPQISTAIQPGPYPCGQTVNSVVDYVLANYPRADPSRIYVTGLSMGGGFTWYGAGITADAPKRLAAIVTMSGVAGVWDTWAYNIGRADLPMWCLTNADDGWNSNVDSPAWVQYSKNSVPAPISPSKVTIWPSGGHDSWTKASDPNYREDGMNVYEWMLSHQRMDVILPVSLGTYEVSAGQTGLATINWSTSYEQHNAYFTISRSTDGANFTVIAKIPAGTQEQGNNYRYTDPEPVIGTRYYRLSQTDIDGKETNFDIKTVSFDADNTANIVKIYPNPVISNNLVLEINNKITGTLNAQILNGEGKTLLSRTISKSAASFKQSINVQSLTKGYYFLKITGDNNYQAVLKFMKN